MKAFLLLTEVHEVAGNYFRNNLSESTLWEGKDSDFHHFAPCPLHFSIIAPFFLGGQQK